MALRPAMRYLGSLRTRFRVPVYVEGSAATVLIMEQRSPLFLMRMLMSREGSVISSGR